MLIRGKSRDSDDAGLVAGVASFRPPSGTDAWFTSVADAMVQTELGWLV